MSTAQAIERPFGISVFGSAQVRVAPDVANIRCAVSRLEQKPKDAFRLAREAAGKVREYLTKAKISEVGASRISLTQQFTHEGYGIKPGGYTAEVEFQIVLRELDRLEEILTGLIEIGVNTLTSVTMQTDRLKEFRALARRNAIAAAREKAELYCEATGVTLGRVIHIEDYNPDMVSNRMNHMQNQFVTVVEDSDEPVRAFDPNEILVSGAVVVAYEIERN